MGLFGKKDSANTTIGVDVGVGGLKLVELEDKGGRPHLSTYGFTSGSLGVEKKTTEEEVGTDDKKKDAAEMDAEQVKILGAALKELVKKTNCKGKSAVASIPISSVFSAVLTVPRTDDPSQLGPIITQEARKLLPVPPEEVVIDHSELPQEFAQENARKNEVKVMMTAAPRKVIARYTAIFKEAGLTLKSLETESFALVRSLVGNDPAAILIMDMGQSRSNLYLVRAKVPLLHRSINMGGRNFTKALSDSLGVTEEEANQMKIDMAQRREGDRLLDVFKPVADPIVNEIKYQIQLFEKQLGGSLGRPEKIILTGGSSMLPHLDTYLEEYFKMRAYVGDPWARVVYPEVLKMPLDQIGPRFGIAVGLALSGMVGDKKKKPDPKKKK